MSEQRHRAWGVNRRDTRSAIRTLCLSFSLAAMLSGICVTPAFAQDDAQSTTITVEDVPTAHPDAEAAAEAALEKAGKSMPSDTESPDVETMTMPGAKNTKMKLAAGMHGAKGHTTKAKRKRKKLHRLTAKELQALRKRDLRNIAGQVQQWGKSAVSKIALDGDWALVRGTFPGEDGKYPGVMFLHRFPFGWRASEPYPLRQSGVSLSTCEFRVRDISEKSEAVLESGIGMHSTELDADQCAKAGISLERDEYDVLTYNENSDDVRAIRNRLNPKASFSWIRVQNDYAYAVEQTPDSARVLLYGRDGDGKWKILTHRESDIPVDAMISTYHVPNAEACEISPSHYLGNTCPENW